MREASGQSLPAHAIASRCRERINSAAMMMMLSAFQASPLTKAAAYEPVASKITPEIQPPNDIPKTEAKMMMPTRVAASAAGIALRTMIAC